MLIVSSSRAAVFGTAALDAVAHAVQRIVVASRLPRGSAACAPAASTAWCAFRGPCCILHVRSYENDDFLIIFASGNDGDTVWSMLHLARLGSARPGPLPLCAVLCPRTVYDCTAHSGVACNQPVPVPRHSRCAAPLLLVQLSATGVGTVGSPATSKNCIAVRVLSCLEPLLNRPCTPRMRLRVHRCSSVAGSARLSRQCARSGCEAPSAAAQALVRCTHRCCGLRQLAGENGYGGWSRGVRIADVGVALHQVGSSQTASESFAANNKSWSVQVLDGTTLTLLQEISAVRRRPSSRSATLRFASVDAVCV